MHNMEEDQMKEWKMEVDLVSFCAVCGKYHSALSYKSRGMGVFVFRTIMNQMYCCRSELACELLTAVLPYKPGSHQITPSRLSFAIGAGSVLEYIPQ